LLLRPLPGEALKSSDLFWCRFVQVWDGETRWPLSLHGASFALGTALCSIKNKLYSN
jgi:hypothetical protein